ncbi:MAG: hypothetical protein IMW99_03745 [Firmicutes bacterium]|nr:hypothetical protein [Bacillota bacterium]
MLNTILSIVITLLGNADVQAAILALLLAALAWVIKRWVWTRNVVGLAIEAYEYAEQQGLLQHLRGFQKFDPFMDKFIARYQEIYGVAPPPKARGVAVQAMEKRVADDHAKSTDIPF